MFIFLLKYFNNTDFCEWLSNQGTNCLTKGEMLTRAAKKRKLWRHHLRSEVTQDLEEEYA